MKITHRKKNQAFSCSTRVYLYNIESFSEAPIEIFFIFSPFFHVFSKFSRLKYVFWWLLCSSLAVDLSRSFLTYLIDNFSTGTLVSALLCCSWTLSAFIPSHRYFSMVRVTHIRLSVWTSCLVVEISCITSASWQYNILYLDDPAVPAWSDHHHHALFTRDFRPAVALIIHLKAPWWPLRSEQTASLN